jgi:hypothetical protein
MTIQDIEASLPNGFHNARVRAIEIRYETNRANVTFDILNDEGTYEPVMLQLEGVLYFVVEPPHSNYHDDYLSDGQAELTVSNSQAHQSEGAEATSDSLMRLSLPSGAFRYRLLVHDWNAYIHFAAMDAQMELRPNSV